MQKIIGPMDASLKLAAAATIAATTNGASIDLGATFNPDYGGVPMLGIVPVTSVKLSAGNETYGYKLQDSPDNATFTDCGAQRTATNEGLTVDGGGGDIVCGGFVRNRYVRLVETLGGTAPSIVRGDCFLQPFVNQIGG